VVVLEVLALVVAEAVELSIRLARTVTLATVSKEAVPAVKLKLH